jgi:hypothetical protein
MIARSTDTAGHVIRILADSFAVEYWHSYVRAPASASKSLEWQTHTMCKDQPSGAMLSFAYIST